MGLGIGTAYRLGEILKSSMGREQATKGWNHFYGVVHPSRKHLKNGGVLGWMKWLKNGAEKAFIFHAVIPTLYPFLVTVLFVKLKCLYIQYACI